MNRQARSLWALASMLLVMGGLGVWILHWRAEEYAVYDAAIREALSGDGVSYYLILDRTQPAGRFGITNFHSEKLGLSLTTRISYAAKNVFRFRIAPKFHLPYPFRMVAQDELDRIFRPGISGSTNVSALEELLRKSWGVITLSRVGFDAGGKHAVVYAQLTYCGLCGEGTYLYLSKEAGAWHIVRRAGTWIS
jgi:hypothetical protein